MKTHFLTSGGDRGRKPKKGRAGTHERADLRVLEVGTTPRGTIATVQVYAGEPRAGLQLMVEGSGQRWEVRGVAFVPPEAVEAGRWGLLLVSVEHDGSLNVDDRLKAA